MSFDVLPNEIVLKLCLSLNIVDFIHLSMTSRRYYKFRKQVFEHKTRLVLTFPSDQVSLRLMKPSVRKCMEQSSNHYTTDLPVEEIASISVNLNNLDISEKAPHFNVFPNVTQLIVIGNDTTHSSLETAINLLWPLFPQVKVLKMIFYKSYFSQMTLFLSKINLPNLGHLSIFARCTHVGPSDMNVKRQRVKQMFRQLEELYICGYPNVGKYILELITKKPNKLLRLGLYFDKMETCLDSLTRMESALNVTHLTMHSSADDYDSLSNEQLQLISRRFPAVQHFIPDALERKINYRQIQQ